MIQARIPLSPTPDQARNTRARGWAFVYDCYAKKNAAGMTSTNGDNAEGSVNDRAKTSIPETH